MFFFPSVPRKTERFDRDPFDPYTGEGERLEEYPKTRENSQRTLPGDIFGAEKQKTLDVGRPGIRKTIFSKILRKRASKGLFPMASVSRKSERSDRDPLDPYTGEGERLEEYPKTRENSQLTLPGDIFGAEKQKALDVGRPGIRKTIFSKILRKRASKGLFPMASVSRKSERSDRDPLDLYTGEGERLEEYPKTRENSQLTLPGDIFCAEKQKALDVGRPGIRKTIFSKILRKRASKSLFPMASVPTKTERSDTLLLCHSDEGERLELYPKTRENSQQTLPGDIFGAEKQKTLDVGRPGFGKTMFSTKILRNPASESLFPMATRNDGDVQDKGRRLWDALKNKKIYRVDRISIIGELLKNGAPVNFREPNSKVRNFINKVSVVIICRGITPHSYLRKKKHKSARKSYPVHRQSNSIVPSRCIIALSFFIHDGGKL